MKKLILVAIIAIFAFAANAQSNIEEIELMQSMYGMQKKELVTKHMTLSTGQAEIFWQMYDEYEVARKEIGMSRAKNIELYAEKYDNLTDEDADAIIKVAFKNYKSFNSLLEKTYKKMAKELSPVTAAQFIQAERFLENQVRQELSMEIPFIGEFETK